MESITKRFLKFFFISIFSLYIFNPVCSLSLFKHIFGQMYESHDCCKGEKLNHYENIQDFDSTSPVSDQDCHCKFHCCHQPYIKQNVISLTLRNIHGKIRFTEKFHTKISEKELFKPPTHLG